MDNVCQCCKKQEYDLLPIARVEITIGVGWRRTYELCDPCCKVVVVAIEKAVNGNE